MSSTTSIFATAAAATVLLRRKAGARYDDWGAAVREWGDDIGAQARQRVVDPSACWAIRIVATADPQRLFVEDCDG